MDKDKFLNEIGQKIYSLRKENNLTQNDFNMPQSKYGSYELGKVAMNILSLKQICEKLKISADYLLDLPNEINNLSDEQKVNYLLMKKLSRDNDLKLTGMILAILENKKDK